MILHMSVTQVTSTATTPCDTREEWCYTVYNKIILKYITYNIMT